MAAESYGTIVKNVTVQYLTDKSREKNNSDERCLLG
jgi:hypothetical protein